MNAYILLHEFGHVLSVGSNIHPPWNIGPRHVAEGASYVHVVLMRRPWQITIARDGKAVHVYESCWNELRYANKQEILEQILRR